MDWKKASDIHVLADLPTDDSRRDIIDLVYDVALGHQAGTLTLAQSRAQVTGRMLAYAVQHTPRDYAGRAELLAYIEARIRADPAYWVDDHDRLWPMRDLRDAGAEFAQHVDAATGEIRERVRLPLRVNQLTGRPTYATTPDERTHAGTANPAPTQRGGPDDFFEPTPPDPDD